MTNKYWLAYGKHTDPSEGRCAMEWVAYLAGEQHTDQPVCVSPLLREFGIALNDRWDDEQRQKLRPYLARCIGTAGDGRDVERSWLAVDWLIRTFALRFLDLRPPEFAEHAAKLHALPPVMTSAVLDDATVILNAARAVPWDAAGAAARDAARDAALDAALDAARAVARDAALAVAWDATGAATGAAAGDAAGDVARAAARAAAHARSRAAAQNVLRPVVVELQASALDLFDRMLPTEVIQLPVVEGPVIA